MKDVRGGLSIGSVSRQTGVNIETIRYYEKCGLLDAPGRSEGGWRLYVTGQVRRLSFIRRGRELGFSLHDIDALLRLSEEGDFNCRDVKDVTLHHLSDVRTRIADLKRLEAALENLAKQCTGGSDSDCPILDALFSMD